MVAFESLVHHRGAIVSARAPITVLADPLVMRARESAHSDFSEKARKSPRGFPMTLIPYVVHLEDVATILADHGFGASVIAAAYLHDHLEDLSHRWSLTKLAKEFGVETATLVNWVTQQDRSADWEERNQSYAVRLKLAPPEAIALSLADKLSNIRSCTRFMEMGFAVESLLKRGWAENSQKFNNLLHIYSGRVPAPLLREYETALTRFDKLGKVLTEMRGLDAARN